MAANLSFIICFSSVSKLSKRRKAVSSQNLYFDKSVGMISQQNASYNEDQSILICLSDDGCQKSENYECSINKKSLI